PQTGRGRGAGCPGRPTPSSESGSSDGRTTDTTKARRERTCTLHVACTHVRTSSTPGTPQVMLRAPMASTRTSYGSWLDLLRPSTTVTVCACGSTAVTFACAPRAHRRALYG